MMVRRGDGDGGATMLVTVLLALCVRVSSLQTLDETEPASTERDDATTLENTTAVLTSNVLLSNEYATPIVAVGQPERAGAWSCPSWCYCDDGLEWSAECTRAELAYSAVWQPDEYVKLTCLAPPARRLLPAELPALLAPAPVQSVGFYSCVLQPGGTWAASLAAVGVTHVTRLTLLGAHTDTLTAAALRGLEALELLAVREPIGDAPWTPPRDLLAATPALLRFSVRGASVHLVAGGLTAAPRTLRTLELGEGRVQLEADAFRGLTNVTRLLLWRAGLDVLPPGVLNGLDALEELELTGNALAVLDAGALLGAPRLRILHAASNPVRRVEAGALPVSLAVLELWRCSGTARLALGAALSGLAALRVARLEYCALEALTPRLLEGATTLQNLTLAGAGLEALPLGLFSDTRALERLDLSFNRLDHLPAGIFANLTSLKELNLDWNRIQILSEGVLSGLPALVVLSARSCSLRVLHVSSLQAGALTHLRLDNNSLTLEEDQALDDTLGPHSGLRSLRALTSLSLAHNHVRRVFTEWRLALSLTRLDLSFNRLTDLTDADLNFLSPNILVDLRNNSISTVRLVNLPLSMTLGSLAEEGSDRSGGASGATILLDDNPYSCDCHLEGFVRRVRAGGAGVRARAARCVSPAALSGRALSVLEPRDLTCAVPTPPCPAADTCTCVARPAADTLELACATLPATLPTPRSLGLAHTSLRLLAAPPVADTLNLAPHVSLLDMSALNMSHVPEVLLARGATLDLRHNALAALSEEQLGAANDSGFTILLAGNPMICPCDALTVKLLNDTVRDWSGSVCVPLACGGGGAVLAGVLLLCVCVCASVAGVLVHYRRTARAFLVARGLWPASGIHEDKAQYDAFVSYSHSDEEWVSGVARRLEAGGARLCLHARDWTPGDWIPAQIARSVADARRTLLVVSDAWAESVWARAEWRAAHERECREGRARVLVVLRAASVPARLPASMRAHLAARTYLPHDDPNLILKLHAALRAPLERPHCLTPVASEPPPVPPLLGPDKLDARY